MPRTTDQLVERIEEEFNIDDLDSGLILDYLTGGGSRIGRHNIKDGFDKSGKQRTKVSSGISSGGLSNIQRLAEEIASAKELKDRVSQAQSLDELNSLDREADRLKPKRYAESIRKQIAQAQQTFEEIEIVKEEIQDEISDATRELTEFQDIRKEEIRRNIESQRLSDISQLAPDLIESEMESEIRRINSQFDRLEREQLRELEIESNKKIRVTLDKKRKFEEILRTTTDKRKRKNARANLKRLSSRL